MEELVVIFGFVLLVIIVRPVMRLIEVWITQRKDALGDSASKEMLGRLAELEERVQVLEKIVTDDDGAADLRRQFRDLGG